MPDNAAIEQKFWEAVKSDRTMFVGLRRDQGGVAQPMTALMEKDREKGPIYFFTSSETDLARAVNGADEADLYFVAKGHDLFASATGRLVEDSDQTMINRLWNPFVAAWFEGGKADPTLRLLRFDLHEAQIWLNEHSLFAGVKLLLGVDPKAAYKDKTAEIHAG